MNALDIWDNWVQNDNTMTEISYSFCDFYDTSKENIHKEGEKSEHTKS